MGAKVERNAALVLPGKIRCCAFLFLLFQCITEDHVTHTPVLHFFNAPPNTTTDETLRAAIQSSGAPEPVAVKIFDRGAWANTYIGLVHLMFAFGGEV